MHGGRWATVAVACLLACGESSSEPQAGTDASGSSGAQSTSASTQSSGASATTVATTTPSTSATTSTSGDATDATAGTETGTSSLDCTLAWSSGFEQGFPGEWSPYDSGAWSPDGTMPPGRVSAWTIIDQASGEPVFEGDAAYKGWIEGTAAESHRAYPGISTDIATPVVNTFMVYLEADYDAMAPGEWIHFGTWGNDDGNGNGQWALHTMSVRDRLLEFAHTEPFLGEYIGPSPTPEFPLGQWVRFTVYFVYEGTTGFVQVWQDGVPMLRADVAQLADNPGTRMLTAHWGMYADPMVSSGVQYNDDIRIWTLPGPLADLDSEPDCYLGS